MAATFKIELQKDYTIMSNHHLRNRNLSLKAKGLQSLMLSLPDNWDYTIRGLVTLSKDGRDSVIAALKELENEGYLVRHRRRNEKGQVQDTEYIIYQIPHNSKPNTEIPTQDKPITENPTQGKPTQENPLQSNTNKSNTYLSNTQSINHSSNSKHQQRNVENYKEVVENIKEQIDYVLLKKKYSDSSQLDEIVSIMTEVMMSDNDIKICGRKISCDMIHNIYSKIDCDCIEYVIDSINEYSKKKRISNIKGYLIATLYNAPITINTHYATECNYDFEHLG